MTCKARPIPYISNILSDCAVVIGSVEGSIKLRCDFAKWSSAVADDDAFQ